MALEVSKAHSSVPVFFCLIKSLNKIERKAFKITSRHDQRFFQQSEEQVKEKLDLIRNRQELEEVETPLLNKSLR